MSCKDKKNVPSRKGPIMEIRGAHKLNKGTGIFIFDPPACIPFFLSDRPAYRSHRPSGVFA